MAVDPYAPPSREVAAGPEPVPEEEALQGIPTVVGLAGMVMGAAGILTAVSGWQIYDLLLAGQPLEETWSALFMPLGVAIAVAGGGLTQARAWSVKLGLGGVGLALVLKGTWQIYALVHGFFTMASFVATVLCLAALVLAIVAAPPALRMAAARARLTAGL